MSSPTCIAGHVPVLKGAAQNPCLSGVLQDNVSYPLRAFLHQEVAPGHQPSPRIQGGGQEPLGGRSVQAEPVALIAGYDEDGKLEVRRSLPHIGAGLNLVVGRLNLGRAG